jgi:hypothetical protein
MASRKLIRKGLSRVNPKAKPEVRVQVGGYSNRIHIDVRLTAAEEKGLYRELHKKYGKMDK